MALIACSAASRIGSAADACSGSIEMVTKTLPSRMLTPVRAPESGSDATPSGPLTARNAV